MTDISTERRVDPKRPLQARSVATFTSILDASTQIIVERGVQGLNTNLVAERAGVNIGTVYHYFPDKTAILVELFRLDRSRRLAYLMDKLSEVSETSDLDEWTSDVLNLALELRRSHPSTIHMRRAFRAVPELVELDRQATADYTEFFTSKIVLRFSNLSAGRARAATRLLIEVAATILDVTAETSEGSEEFIAEGVLALTSYLHSLDAR